MFLLDTTSNNRVGKASNALAKYIQISYTGQCLCSTKSTILQLDNIRRSIVGHYHKRDSDSSISDLHIRRILYFVTTSKVLICYYQQCSIRAAYSSDI